MNLYKNPRNMAKQSNNDFSERRIRREENRRLIIKNARRIRYCVRGRSAGIGLVIARRCYITKTYVSLENWKNLRETLMANYLHVVLRGCSTEPNRLRDDLHES